MDDASLITAQFNAMARRPADPALWRAGSHWKRVESDETDLALDLKLCATPVPAIVDATEPHTVELSFLQDTRLVRWGHSEQSQGRSAFALWNVAQHALFMLDGTNEPIYSAASLFGLKSDARSLRQYVRFFFAFVVASHGQFLIAECADDIAWNETASEGAKTQVIQLLKPLHILSRPSDTHATLQATVMFQNGLFESKVRLVVAQVDSGELGGLLPGDLELFDEHLLLENLPVTVDNTWEPPPAAAG